MKVGDMIRFSKKHWVNPGVEYTKDWLGLLVDEVFDPEGELEELHIFWNHGKVSDYPSSWWNQLSYFPFEVVDGSR